ncbi:hypothetical protein [Bacillus sp. JCM 19041]|uniref:hypothetical protein n=1 Tax=Bacillus sp. JCM 19041 TaxID=1460637 RepID=UPI000A528F59
MFSPFDWLRLLMSALFYPPLTTIIRESGYYLAASILGGTNKKLIIGSGPILFTLPTVEVRRYFFMYSWMQYDELRPSNRFWHGFIYASPIITTGICAFTVNSLILSGTLENNIFWSTFIFYCFYFMLFDVIPVYLPDGQPTNGRAIFDLIWHGERSDYLKQQKEENENDEDDDTERSHTKKQEETMENRDRDEEERGDHTNPENDEPNNRSDSSDQEDTPERGYTEEQEETMENRDRDEEERGDHTNPENDKPNNRSDSSDQEDTPDRSQTEAQEETMKNRDRDEEERGDHTNPENDERDNHSNQKDKHDQ